MFSTFIHAFMMSKRNCAGVQGKENNMSSIMSGVGVNPIVPQTDYAEKIAEKAKDAVAAGAKTGAVNPPASGEAAVYEKTAETGKAKEPYSINRMSKEERATLVEALRSEQEARQKQLVELVTQMLNGQGKAFSIATDNTDAIWKVLAEGDFVVDEAAKKQAQEDIAENGYWGVEQTSQRMFDFASALAGDDVEQMKAMQEAMKKGYEEATKVWGKDLPEITKKTMEAANKLFDEYYKSKGVTPEAQAMASQSAAQLTNQAAAAVTAGAEANTVKPDQAVQGVQSVTKG